MSRLRWRNLLMSTVTEPLFTPWSAACRATKATYALATIVSVDVQPSRQFTFSHLECSVGLPLQLARAAHPQASSPQGAG
jgi:hypothetical protein